MRGLLLLLRIVVVDFELIISVRMRLELGIPAIRTSLPYQRLRAPILCILKIFEGYITKHHCGFIWNLLLLTYAVRAQGAPEKLQRLKTFQCTVI